MGFWDWIGPTSLTKRRGWDALPSVPTEQKLYAIQDFGAALRTSTMLVHGPGATDILAGRGRGNDGNSAVWACLQAIATAYVEAPVYAYRQTSPKDREPLLDSPLQAFLDDCNPAFDLLELLAWVQIAKRVDGNAYLRKIRSGNPETGNVVALWPISPTRMEIKTTEPGDFISFYRYWVTPSKHEDISTDNVIHFRHGIDDRDHRRGCSDLKKLMREISSDDQATRYADRLLANLAINGLSLEFDKDTASIDQDTADILKQRIQSAYGGDNVGAVSVLSPGARLVSHGFSPEQMDLGILHTVPEERISAVLRVPAIVAGLGAGLQRSTFANFKEAREAFTEATILPSYQADDRVLTKHLARDFTSDRTVVIAHDISQMRALQDDENAKATRLSTYVASEILTHDEARAEIGREPLPERPAPAALPALPEQRGRPTLVRLPSRETKALDDLPGLFDALRDDSAPVWQAEVAGFLAEQLARIITRLRAGHDTAEGLVVEGEATLLGEVLTPLQTSALEEVHRLVVAELGIAYDLDDAATRQYLQEAGRNIVGITDHTRDAVRAALIEGQTAGEGIPQLAARLRNLPAFNTARAVTVSRTELAIASNLSALTSYRASSVVVGVRIFDGDYDAECAAMNGRVFPLDQPPSLIQHPRCRRALAPILDAAELERSA